MNAKGRSDTGRRRQDRLIKERVHDPYCAGAKLAGPAVCPGCGVAYIGGRWQWAPERPGGAREETCPACRRRRDHVPAGILHLRGEYFAAHREEIMRLIANKVDRQNAQHPMKRIMAIDDSRPGETVVLFTDTHLPRGVGQAIRRAHRGDLDVQYTDESGIVRVIWESP